MAVLSKLTKRAQVYDPNQVIAPDVAPMSTNPLGAPVAIAPDDPNPQPPRTPQPPDQPAPTPTSQAPTTPSYFWGTGIPTMPVSGWDPTKWNNPDYRSNKYDAGRITAAINPVTDYDRWRTAQLGLFTPQFGEGVQLVGDKLTLPNGDVWDLVRDFGPGGLNESSWNLIGGPNFRPETGAALPFTGTAEAIPFPTGGATSTGGSLYTGAPSEDPFASIGGGVFINGGWVPKAMAPAGMAQQTATTAQETRSTGQPSDIQSAYRSAILSLLQTPRTVDPEALRTSSEAAAFRLGAQRGTERQQAQLAEQASREGRTPSGAELRGLGQARTEAEANFLGTLAIQRLEQQRQDLLNGIQEARMMGQFDQAQALQRELAQMNDALQRARLAQEGQIAGGELDLKRLQLAQQADQFLKSLGYDYTALQLGANRNAILDLLGAA